ncbi:MAG TPA: SsrA-binding protein SmpB [Nitrospinota bacterium]|nr:SsrA-binding protein SmpB [Nitrospinota bacterium]
MVSQKIICKNKKASHDYHLSETYEAGIVLKGTEVKSLREGKVNLKESYASIEGGEVYLYNCHISPYSHGSDANHNPLRTKKLLFHKKEIKKLTGKIKEKGLTLIPLKLYFLNGIAKIEMALAKGKKLYDKREDMKMKDAKKDIERAFKNRQRI